MIEQLRQLGINVKAGSRGDVKTICPKCSNERKKKNDPSLSVNVDEGVWNCWHCGWASSIGAMSEKKKYTRPEQKELKKLSDSVVKWFEARGISNQTLLRYRISEGKEWMPQVSEDRNTIHFNYFLNGQLVNVKYRDRDKNFKLVSGAQLSLYGLDVALENSDEEIVITEGECDVLAFYEAGIKTAVSVPNGASKGNAKLDWLEEMLPHLEGKKIYLATDNDEAGLSLRGELARRLGKQNCWVIEYPEKDANDTLVKHGGDALLNCFRSAHPFPIEGIEDVSEDDLLKLWDEGYPEGFELGWKMDSSFKIHEGQVTLITGSPGDGKSTMVKNVITRLADLHDWPFGVYSAEEATISMALTDLVSIKTGKPFFNTPMHPRITREEVKAMTPWLKGHFKYYSMVDGDYSIETILEKATQLVRKFGIKGLVIDNMSKVEKNFSKNADNRHHSIGDMLGDIMRFARNYGVHVFLVAHPKKMQKDKNGKPIVATGYDVSDSSNYFNFPDNGWTVYRNRQTGLTELHRWKVRFKYTGQEGVDYFNYDVTNSRFTDGEEKKKFSGQADHERFIKAGIV